jgi:hypothetical protein
MIYLVTGDVRKTYYMDDKRSLQTEIDLVEADSPQMAATKFKEHYEKQTKNYSIYYYVENIKVKQTIK